MGSIYIYIYHIHYIYIALYYIYCIPRIPVIFPKYIHIKRCLMVIVWHPLLCWHNLEIPYFSAMSIHLSASLMWTEGYQGLDLYHSIPKLEVVWEGKVQWQGLCPFSFQKSEQNMKTSIVHLGSLSANKRIGIHAWMINNSWPGKSTHPYGTAWKYGRPSAG